MPDTVNLSWGRFALAIGVLNGVPLLLALTGNGLDSSLMIVWLVAISLSIFFAFGWARLRRENAVSPLSAFDKDRFKRVLIGPPVPAIVWFAATMAVAIGLAVMTAL
ncbi:MULTISPECIES: hypothetical protein [unclassified Lysobacter]|uniref:hypothetical protein n=1 Tax=unclassified Lysobacter TaxID=2635362 RepID=UPI00070DD141|nr:MULTISPECIES: hypothetical protein [unclassified Lysobacter]KRD31822.1 hypothetical protein ASE35_12640 [Lysobacter sp. Root916]KRD75691.1 hypothetical protein ASE43_12640 [Lysobacter sp. Root983]